MFDSRFYQDSYDLYRPTISTTAGGRQSVDAPGTATAANQSCHYSPKPGRTNFGERGVELVYDAAIHIPNGRDLRPTKVGEQPDYVKVGARWFTVLICWDAAGRGLHQTALLEERRP